MTNYFDKQGNYINCENLSLAEIYHRAFALGVESVAINKRQQGDLISREALKETIQNREECKECTDIDCISCFYEIIDNAPTVETYTKEDMRKEYKRGITDAYKVNPPI